MTRIGGCVVLLLLVGGTAEQVMLARIRRELEQRHGNAYAILNLHMGGDPAEIPSLGTMLRWACHDRISPRYRPEGSAGLTGKKHYLILLVGDQAMVHTYTWSFRCFRLEKEASEPWDLLANLPPAIRDQYRFDPAGRIQRRGLWFCGPGLNDPDRNFYWRRMLPDRE